jgi:arylsulfatase A-like enzyme
MDLAPTLLDMLNIKSPQSFQGRSIYKKNYKKNEFVIFENTGNGNCDIKNKKIIIAVRSKELKVIYEIIKFKIHEREVYDIKNDKWELNNLVKENFSPNIREKHLKIVEQRIKKIKTENNI